MNTAYRRFPKTNSILTLGALVFAGAVITTLAHAEGATGLRYLSAGALPDADSTPSRHRWLLPEGVEGRLEVGDYHMRFPAQLNGSESPDEMQPVQLRLAVGASSRQGQFRSRPADRALMSDSEREQHRLNDPLLSMSVSRSW